MNKHCSSMAEHKSKDIQNNSDVAGKEEITLRYRDFNVFCSIIRLN
jgi:hypothetical protein